MKFPKIKIENFLAITEAEINLADRGLCLIQGKNNADTSAKSNGAGKSSIADALCWCWFGTTARGEGGNDVVNSKAGKNCRVISTLVDGGVTYTATRHRKHSKGKNRLFLEMSDGLTTTDLTKGTDKMTQEVADKIIGASLEVFAGSIYAGQEKMPDLPAMTDKMLKMLIEESAGVTLLEEAYKKAREDLGGAQTALQHADADVSALETRVQTTTDDVTAARTDAKNWVRQRDARVQDKTGEVRRLVGEVKTIDAELQKFDKAAINKAIADIDAKIGSVSGEHSKLADLEREVTSAESALATARSGFKRVEADAKDLVQQYKDVEGQVGQPCSKCARPLTENEVSATKAALHKDVDAAKKSLASLKDEIEKAVKARDEAVAARDSFKKGMTDVSAEQAERKRQEALLSDCTKLESDRGIKVSEAKAAKARIEDIKAEKNPYEARIEGLEWNLEKMKKDLAGARKTLQARQAAVEVEEQVVRVFSPAGVRARVLDEVTPFLNAQTAKYLSVLSDGNLNANWTTLTPGAKAGEFKEKFSIEVTNATGGGKFKLISGGEKRKVRIATALALQDLVATRASKPIDLFIGDEIDDALDSSGLERLMIILDEKAKERGSVFVISHNELSDHIRQVLTVEKTAAGETKITETAA